MTVPASWLPDPTGQHQFRYWDGVAWTSHVATGGVAAEAPLAPGVALPPPSTPPAPGPAAAAGASPAGAEAGWKDVLERVADTAGDLAGRARSAVSEATAAPAPVVAAAVAAPAPAADAPVDVDELAAQLRELGKLRDEGLLTDEEFAAQKARLLGG